MSTVIPFLPDRAQQAEYLLSLADANGISHEEIQITRDGWRVPDELPYDESAVSGYLGGGLIEVVNAGTNLDLPRPDAACVYWKFDSGVDAGSNGENITNGRPGDLVFVAA